MKELRICFSIDATNRVVVTLKHQEYSFYRRSADMYPSRESAQQEIDKLLISLAVDIKSWLNDATITEERLDTGEWRDVGRG